MTGGTIMKYNEWQNKRMGRSDLSQYLIHLTKGDSKNSLTEMNVMLKILNDKKLIGSTTSSGFIVGSTTAVCLQDAPLFSVGQNIWYENNKRKSNPNQKVRYGAYGILFRKRFIYDKGGRPVIYDKTEDAKKYIHESKWWKIVNLDLSNSDNITDWTHEREWRVPGDLQFNLKDIVIVLPNDEGYRTFVDICLTNNYESILKGIGGVVNLSLIF